MSARVSAFGFAFEFTAADHRPTDHRRLLSCTTVVDNCLIRSARMAERRHASLPVRHISTHTRWRTHAYTRHTFNHFQLTENVSSATPNKERVRARAHGLKSEAHANHRQRISNLLQFSANLAAFSKTHAHSYKRRQSGETHECVACVC